MNTVEEELQQMQQQMQQMQIHFYNQQQQQTQNMQYLQYPTMGMAAGGLQGGTPYFHQQAQSSSIPQQQQPLYYQPPPQGVGFYPLNPPPLPMDSPCSLQLYNGQHHHNTLPHTLPHPAPPPRRSSIASSHESSNSATPSSSSQSQSTALFHNLNTHTTPHLLLQRPLSSVSVVSSSPSISTSSSSPAPAPAPGTAAAAAGHGLRRHPSPSHVPFAASTTVASSSSSLSSSSSSSTTTTVPSSITASLQDYRDVAKYSNDPAIHLDFAKLLIQSAERKRNKHGYSNLLITHIQTLSLSITLKRSERSQPKIIQENSGFTASGSSEILKKSCLESHEWC